MEKVGWVPALRAASGFMYPIRAFSLGLFGTALYRAPGAAAAVALTFDDGPSEGTPALLDLLARHAVPATFFLTGANVERLPAIARDVLSEGHEVGNHAYSHRAFCFRSVDFIRGELERAQQAITAATGFVPRLFRPPFGTRWFGSRAARALGLTEVMWTVMGRDWKLDGNAIVARVARLAAAGAIICLHDGRELNPNPDIRATLDAADRIIPLLRSRGLQFQTVSRLCLMN